MKRKLKVILVMVTSLNGKSTRGDTQSPSYWASSEDQLFFRSVIEENSLLVMGRKTYEAAKPAIKLTEGKLRVIVTKNPENFVKEEIPGQLEFTNDSPKQIVQNFDKKGYTTMILLGGSSLNSAFFKEKAVDELWLTLEPHLFSKGKGLVENMNGTVNLQLKTFRKLNTRGTLLIKYQVLQ